KTAYEVGTCLDSRRVLCRSVHSDLSLMDEVLDTYADTEGSLTTILQKAQEIYGYLPMGVIRLISDRTGVKPAKIMGVATFYAQLDRKSVVEAEVAELNAGAR